MTTEQKEAIIKTLTEKMKKAARNLEFEDAAALRDRIRAIEKEMITASLD